MKPTLSLSAADAPNRPLPVASTAAAAAMRIFLMDFSVSLTGGRCLPERGAPSRALRASESLSVGHKDGSERCGRGRAAGSCTGDQDKDNDGGKIGQRRHELRGDTHAPALRVKLEDRYRAEQ